ncbi:ABC-2 type transport system ATP-binding protein [Lipingzhangella halophila]|uniref:ABC-2 type transport system ATP-binding protein n=1 Tax=Lipingzhangella halophila TaxID=1783352 RepID=A0A7W7RI21_9ACTN|nr:ATP-binding cassette domain-containing protein [Lipingzhangella halophila]MBB4932350.1 ABC-2 type transport system ATP-binding protein [Lipingzhangella halophila]
MRPPIEVRELCKSFGAITAVRDLSFTVPPGRVTGFVGPNGSGKSTTMRMILALDRPDSGVALVAGRHYRTLRTPLREIGALLDSSAVHPGRRARDHLLWMAHAGGLPASRVDEVLGLVGLAEAARRPAGEFSHGMLQRLGIAGALLGDPATLILDEPTNGLDPEGVVWVRELLRSLAAEGRALLVSSHLMGELEDTADRVVVIARGRLLAETTVEDLVARASDGRITVRTGQREQAIGVLARAGGTVVATGGEQLTVSGLPSERATEVLTEGAVSFSGVRPHRASLEEAYMELTRDPVVNGSAGEA